MVIEETIKTGNRLCLAALFVLFIVFLFSFWHLYCFKPNLITTTTTSHVEYAYRFPESAGRSHYPAGTRKTEPDPNDMMKSILVLYNAIPFKRLLIAIISHLSFQSIAC